MRIFVGGSKGLVLFEDGEETNLAEDPVECLLRLPTRLLAGTVSGRVLVWENNGDARVAAKDIGEGINDLRAAARGAVFAASFPAGAWISRDGGETWDDLPAFEESPGAENWGVTDGYPLASAVATHPRDSKTIYIGVEAGGVYRTRNTGKKWFDLGLPSDGVQTIEVSPAKHDRVYVTTTEGCYCSDDEGFNWRKMGISNVKQVSLGLSAHPVEADRVIVSASSGNPDEWDRKSPTSDIYLSTDAGRRFRTVAKNLKGKVGRRGLVINPKVPSEVAFATSNGDVHYSNDGGESFDKVGTKLGDIATICFA
jgi:photosystem II stability/assembly factor-like uncharacterized protein